MRAVPPGFGRAVRIEQAHPDLDLLAEQTEHLVDQRRVVEREAFEIGEVDRAGEITSGHMAVLHGRG